MNPWRRRFEGLAFVVICATMIAVAPLISLAAPQGVTGTPLFLPVVVRPEGATPTPTRTATATATSTATATLTATPTATPTGTSITPTIPITVGVGVLNVFAPFTI